MTKQGGKIVFEGTPNPGQCGMAWQDHIRRMYQGAFDAQYTAIVEDWAEAWKSYEIPQPLVSDLQFPKWRDEAMEEQGKQKQEETDRYFAWLGAKHALRVVKADLGAAEVRLAAARLQMEEAKREIKSADELHAKALRAVECARAIVVLLAPLPDLSLPGE